MIRTYYKLTDADGYTRQGLHGETYWSVGAVIYPTGSGSSACGPGVIHLYRHPLEAMLFNPIHADYTSPRLWRVQTEAPVETDGLKYWTQGAVLVVEELARPEPLPHSQYVAWAILVARTMPQLSAWTHWADRWLDKTDRTAVAAGAASSGIRTTWAAGVEMRAAEAAAAAAAEKRAASAERTAWAMKAAWACAASAAAAEVAATKAAWAAWAAAEVAAVNTGSLDWVALWEQAAQYAEDQ